MTTIHRTSAWLDADVNADVMMMHAETGQFMSLNETAGFIWKTLAAPQSEDALLERITGRFDVSESEARDDMWACLGVLVEQGAITLAAR